jgi:hypothetical protein
MSDLTRKDLEARYILFEYFALRDQRNYYQRTITKYDEAASQVSRIRAAISLMTGIAAAFAGLLAQSYFATGTVCSTANTGVIPAWCWQISIMINVAIILSVALPALGGFFNTLADLYQWDKQISIYKNALENIEVADAHSPLDDMDNQYFLASLLAYTEGTLQVMSDESTQWGQSIRTPMGILAYIEDAKEKAAKVGGDADAPIENETDSSASDSSSAG